MNKNKIENKLEKINKKYWDTIEKAKQKRDKELSKYSNCLVYCDCGNELTSSKSFVSDKGEQENNVVTYKCSHCSEESKFNFDIAPVAIKIK
jgi:RNase P subunit RPR2